MRSAQHINVIRSSFIVGAALAAVLGTPVDVGAQGLKDVKTPETPLVLKAQGSFFVGGEKVDQTQGELGISAREGTSPSIRCTCGTWCRRVATATCPW